MATISIPTFGRYGVQHLIGVGATGRVFRAEDLETRTPVAIKTLEAGLSLELSQQVVDELHLVSDLPPHPAIVALEAAGLENDEPFFAMRLVPGEPLDQALERFGPAAIADVLPRLGAIADGLDHVAAHGFCHGALNPRDVIVSRDSTVVTGVGVAESIACASGMVLIRQPYSAPELAEGETPSNASDQFSLAAIAFEWIFGEPISSPANVAMEIPALPEVDGKRLSNVFTRALASSPSERFESCRAFVEEISAAVYEATEMVMPDRSADIAIEPYEGDSASEADGSVELETPTTVGVVNGFLR